jgi:hypothetical protein
MHGEVVVYRVKAAASNLFWQYREQLIADYGSLCEGLVAARIVQSCKDSNVMVDIWEWESALAAARARSAFQSLPSAAAFMTCVDNVIWSSQVQPVVD